MGGKTYGVAKGYTMYTVKVIDKDGVGGPYTKIGNNAIKAATDLGINIVVAARNDRSDATNYSPASAPSAITIGAINSASYRTLWSNCGKVVDIFAPGSDILSAGHLSDSSSVYKSGTSMATPHIAGLAAYFMAKEGLRGSTAVTKRIISAANNSSTEYAFDSPQRVAYNSGGK
ncbi:putative endopeptidase K [Fusarium bulbicola]|nr:putative endopeptidase K [Fusarium bulbicola]